MMWKTKNKFKKKFFFKDTLDGTLLFHSNVLWQQRRRNIFQVYEESNNQTKQTETAQQNNLR